MLEKNIIEIANNPAKKMIFGKKEKEQFNKETKCWICNVEFKEDDKKVRDHFILLVGTVEQHTTSAILIIRNLILHLWYFIILVGMIVIYL